MPTNLVSSVTKILTPELVRRLASGLGVDKAFVEQAVTAGVPGLLAALTSLVAKPGGAERLSDAVAQEQPGILTNIANTLGGPGQGALIDNGVSMLSSLLGGSNASALTGAFGTAAGLIMAFGAVGGESVDPSQKARVLAEGIATAMNCTSFASLVWLASAVTLFLVNRNPRN